MYLGKTSKGSVHDYGMFKEEFPPQKPWFKSKKVNLDCGFTGFEKDYICKEVKMPHKKPRKTKLCPDVDLTGDQKARNRSLSRVRVVVEHAIGGMKRYRILCNSIRIKKTIDIDRNMIICAGLWNYYLKNVS